MEREDSVPGIVGAARRVAVGRAPLPPVPVRRDAAVPQAARRRRSPAGPEPRGTSRRATPVARAPTVSESARPVFRIPSPPFPPGYVLLSFDDALALLAAGVELPPGVIPVIPSPHDGCWHRPLTLLELGVLQGLPPILDGLPLVGSPRTAAAAAGDGRQGRRQRVGGRLPA